MNPNKRVLLIEDDRMHAAIVKRYLDSMDIQFKWKAHTDNIFKLIENYQPAVIIADILLPGELDGMDICYEVKNRWPHIQLILLSALNETKDKVKGLMLGADDYLGKPFDPDEFRARMHVLLRRGQTQEQQTHGTEAVAAGSLKHGPIQLNLESQEVQYLGQTLDLRQQEFQLLLYLMQNPNKTLSREKILIDVWQSSSGLRTVDAHIQRLRKAFYKHSDLIQTVHGQGYRFFISEKD